MLESFSDGEWVSHGEFETGLEKEDGVDKARHIKLEQPIETSKVRIVIQENMVTNQFFIAGRVGFVADRVNQTVLPLITQAIEDWLGFKHADQVDEEPTK